MTGNRTGKLWIDGVEIPAHIVNLEFSLLGDREQIVRGMAVPRYMMMSHPLECVDGRNFAAMKEAFQNAEKAMFSFSAQVGKTLLQMNNVRWRMSAAGRYRLMKNGVHQAFIGIPGNAHQRRLLVRQLRRDGFIVERQA